MNIIWEMIMRSKRESVIIAEMFRLKQLKKNKVFKYKYEYDIIFKSKDRYIKIFANSNCRTSKKSWNIFYLYCDNNYNK